MEKNVSQQSEKSQTVTRHDYWKWWLLFQVVASYLVAMCLAFLISAPIATFVSSTSASIQGASLFQNNPYAFIGVFAVVSVVMYYFVKHINDQRFWTFFFGLGAFAGVFITIMYLSVYLFSVRVSYGIAIIFPLLLLFIRQKTHIVWVHNLLIIIASVGVARVFGVQFTPERTIFILVILAVYDVLAVYSSKHMVGMAKTLFDREAFFGMILPHTLAGWKKKYTDIEIGQEASALGAGDISFPLFFALTMLFHQGRTAFFITAASILIGVIVLHGIYVTQKNPRPMPGLPPLVLACIAAYLLIGWL